MEQRAIRGRRVIRSSAWLLATAVAGLMTGCPEVGAPSRSVAITALAFSATGEMVVSDAAGRIQFLDANARVMQRIQAHIGSASGVAFNTASSKVVSVGDDGRVSIRNRNGELLVNKSVSSMGLKTVAFQPGATEDTETLATGGNDGMARILRGDNADQVGAELGGHVGAINSVVYGPAGTAVAGVIITTGDDGTLRGFLADGSSANAAFSQDAHNRAGNAVTFSPDGALCPTASDDGIVRVWPAAQAGMPGWTPLFELPHAAPVLSVAFSPDGAIIGTASADGTARLWNSADGEPLRVLDGRHTGPINAIAFNPNAASRLVATAGGDGRVVLWNVDTGQPLE